MATNCQGDCVCYKCSPELFCDKTHKTRIQKTIVCETCEERLCPHCFALSSGKHAGHKVADASAAADQRRHELLGKEAEILGRCTAIMTTREQNSAKRKEIEKELERTSSQIREATVSAQASISATFERMEASAQQVADAKLLQLTTQDEELGKRCAAAQAVLKQHAVTDMNENELLRKYSETKTTYEQTLETCKPEGVAVADSRLSLTINVSPLQQHINSLDFAEKMGPEVRTIASLSAALAARDLEVSAKDRELAAKDGMLASMREQGVTKDSILSSLCAMLSGNAAALPLVPAHIAEDAIHTLFATVPGVRHAHGVAVDSVAQSTVYLTLPAATPESLKINAVGKAQGTNPGPEQWLKIVMPHVVFVTAITVTSPTSVPGGWDVSHTNGCCLQYLDDATNTWVPIGTLANLTTADTKTSFLVMRSAKVFRLHRAGYLMVGYCALH